MPLQEEPTLFDPRGSATLYLLTVLWLAGCAAPPRDEAATHVPFGAAGNERHVRPSTASAPALRSTVVAGANLPYLTAGHGDERALVGSNLSFAVDDLLRYEAAYAIEPGKLFAPEATGAPPQLSLAGQRYGQDLEVQLPVLLGVPLSLALSSEVNDQWSLAGYTQAHREHVALEGLLGKARVDVRVAGTAAASPQGGAALACDVQGIVRLPLADGSGQADALRLSGRSCVVTAASGPYAGAEATFWGVGYAWGRPAFAGDIMLSRIESQAPRHVHLPGTDPSYELALRHSRDFGSVQAKAFVALHQASIWDRRGTVAHLAAPASERRLSGTFDASLTWDLTHASVSASWALGADPVWFTPDIGDLSDRVGLAVNLSRWLATLAPGDSTSLAVNWKWSQVRRYDDADFYDGSLSLDLGLAF